MKIRKYLIIFLEMTCLCFPSISSANQVLFSDNFEITLGLDFISGTPIPHPSTVNFNQFPNWNVVEGTADLIRRGDGGIFCSGTSFNCVDLDGTSSNAATLVSKQSFDLSPGITYRLSFAISGNQRLQFGNNPDTVTVSLATFSESFTRNPNDPFETITRTFTVNNPITAKLQFNHAGGDNIGIILDNVSLTSQSLDTDGDGVLDVSDNCPNNANADQADNDQDGQGDVCDIDDDNDGINDVDDQQQPFDNCPFASNPNQIDSDGDGSGDVCDSDRDNDSIANANDNCPLTPNLDQADLDGDLIGDACDPDDDNDGINDDVPDNCPITSNPGQADLDGDGIGDACDSDIDGDNFDNNIDYCPLVSSSSNEDTDGDGKGDACDADDDNDLVTDASDNCPLIYNADQANLDGDGLGDACDNEIDGDGIPDALDNCPLIPNQDQNDFDTDGIGDACDADSDGDGVANGADTCAETPIGAIVDPVIGCSIAQLVPCDGPRGSTERWRNHGQRVSTFTKTVQSFIEKGLISEAEAGALVSEAAQSACGKK